CYCCSHCSRIGGSRTGFNPMSQGSNRRGAQLPTQLETPLGQFHDDRIVLAFRSIVFPQFLPQPTNLQPNNRVLARIVGRWLPEGVDSDRVFLELIRFAGESLVREESEKASKCAGSVKGVAFKNTFHLSPGLFL